VARRPSARREDERDDQEGGGQVHRRAGAETDAGALSDRQIEKRQLESYDGDATRGLY
jgi:hypothetical protein